MKKIIWPALALLFMGIIVYQCESKDTAFDDFKNAEIAKSKKIVDSLSDANNALEVDKKELERKIDSLEEAFLVFEKKVLIINTVKDEKIRVIDSYTPGELQQYFSNRYPKYE